MRIARSFLLDLTSFPLSIIIGLIPLDISSSAANKPAGPAPTTITSLAFSTLLKLKTNLLEFLKGSKI